VSESEQTETTGSSYEIIDGQEYRYNYFPDTVLPLFTTLLRTENGINIEERIDKLILHLPQDITLYYSFSFDSNVVSSAEMMHDTLEFKLVSSKHVLDVEVYQYLISECSNDFLYLDSTFWYVTNEHGLIYRPFQTLHSIDQDTRGLKALSDAIKEVFVIAPAEEKDQ